jgi:biopolymer transport protein ExbB
MLSDWFEQVVSYLNAGGCVIIILLGVSTWMWTLIVVKLKEIYAFMRMEISLNECLACLKQKKDIPGWQGQLIKNFVSKRNSDPEIDRKLLDVLAGRYYLTIDRHIKTILILAGTAPLLGLMGTVTGMIACFNVISLFGTGNARALSLGISEALITTQIGLIVAIPGLLAGNFLRRRAEQAKARIKHFCSSLLESQIVNNFSNTNIKNFELTR